MGRITIDGVSKVYGSGADSLLAVSDLDLDIEDGEFLVLVGPSGCGKSTTLRMIAGLETISEGEISIGDRVVNGMEPKDRDIAMVFQNYALYPHKTVAENIGFGLKYSSDLSKPEIRERVEEVADLMGITELLDDRPKELSGGQQQRVALGRAIVRDPSAFLFDEPLSNLDAKLRAHMRTEIASLQNELGVTSIYVTHDQAEAMTMGDRIAVMNDGELQQVGSPNDVYTHPKNRFVAGFIGSPRMNFIEVRLEKQDGTYVLLTEDDVVEYSLPDSIVERVGIEAGDTVLVGVRPEDVAVDDDDERTVRATVDVVEPMGSDNFLTVDVGDRSWIVRADSSYAPDTGTDLRLTFEPEALHLFAADGRTLKSQGTDETAFHVGTDVSPSINSSR